MKKSPLVIIAVALSIMYMHQTALICRIDAQKGFMAKAKMFSTFAFGFEFYQKNIEPLHKSRFIAPLISTQFFRGLKDKKGNIVIDNNVHQKVTKIISGWNGFWMLATLLLCIFAIRNSTSSIIWVFGIFAGASWNWMPKALGIIYPYDGMILFVWTAMVLIGMSKKYRTWLPLIIVLGMCVKETPIVGALIPLLWIDKPWKERIKWFLFCGAVAVITKTIIGIAVGNPHLFFSEMTCARPEIPGYPSAFVENMRTLFHPGLDWVLFTIGGMLASLFFLPNKPVLLGWKFIAIAYIVNVSIMGLYTEYRIFNEMIPVFLWSWTEGVNVKLS